jgi:hypothetical protein|nr:MAG TPA: hypothetical protein [Bacteriophage sp.]
MMYKVIKKILKKLGYTLEKTEDIGHDLVGIGTQALSVAKTIAEVIVTINSLIYAIQQISQMVGTNKMREYRAPNINPVTSEKIESIVTLEKFKTQLQGIQVGLIEIAEKAGLETEAIQRIEDSKE